MNDRRNSKEKAAIWMATVALFCLGATAQAGPCQDLEDTEVFLRFLETAASASAPPDARAEAQLLRYAQRAEDQRLALAMHVSVDAQKTVARLTRVARDPVSLARLPRHGIDRGQDPIDIDLVQVPAAHCSQMHPVLNKKRPACARVKGWAGLKLKLSN